MKEECFLRLKSVDIFQSMTHKLQISRPVRHFRLNKNSVTIILKLYTIFSSRRDYFHLQNIDIMVVLDN